MKKNYQKYLKKTHNLRKSHKTGNALVSSSSFLERTKQVITEADVIAALYNDIECLHLLYGDQDSLWIMKDYCKWTLRPFFQGTTFPKTGVNDNYSNRMAYLNAANNWYSTSLYYALNCEF